MNKKSLYILSFLFLLLSLSGLIYIYLNKFETRNMRENFSKIDSISNTDPEKASLFLDSISNLQLSNDENNYRLLLNQAIDIEKDIYPKSDSLINYLLFQFLTSDDSTNITRAFYLRGLFLQKEGNSLEAASSFINAEDFIPGCKNKKLKYQITSSLADIYNHNKLYKHEIEAREKALEYAEDFSDSTAITSSLINLAKAYTNLDSNRVANIDRIRQLIYIIPDSDPEAIPELTKELSTNYEKLQQYDSALYCIDFALSIENNLNKKLGYSKVKGNLLEKTGRPKDALKLYLVASRSSVPEDKLGAYQGLYKIYTQLNNPDSALFYSDKLICLQDSIRKDFTEEALEKLNSIQSYKKQRKAFIENKFEI
ncbi:MAG: tetratricopeptide repeat protein, partial [Bacteroidales bacterium]